MSWGKRETKNRQYTQADIDAFFSAVARLGTRAAAAAELGFNERTCYGWKATKGVLGHGPHPRKNEYLQLRAAGTQRIEAARHVGVHISTARDWDRGIRRINRKRIRPAGQVIDYKSGVTTFLPPVPAAAEPINTRYLSLPERETIRDMTVARASLRSIAAALGRSPSTISREIARNSVPDRGYLPYAANRAAAGRRPRPKQRKLQTSPRLRAYVKSKLRIRWSPEQISHTLVKTYPDDQEMRVTHETIYQALYLQGRGGLRREVAATLRTGRARRKSQNTGDARRQRFADEMVMISDRPAEVDDRAVPGHWEGDLITGTLNQSAIGTLVERTTRYVMLLHLPHDHTAESVRDALVTTMGTLPEHLRGSLTWDQGAEMAAHKSFKIATDIDVYFCDPASPWQRGTNENTNGLLRQYFPKGTDLTVYGPEDLEHVAQELNARPRKTLDWDTPAERLRDLIQST
jgi:IS30 family transposase